LRSRCISLIFNFVVRWVWVINITPRPLYTRERPGTLRGRSVWTGKENIVIKEIRSLDGPNFRQSLHQLSCLCPQQINQQYSKYTALQFCCNILCASAPWGKQLIDIPRNLLVNYCIYWQPVTNRNRFRILLLTI